MDTKECFNWHVKLCYNDDQKPFLDTVRDRNLTNRHFIEVEMRRLAGSTKTKDHENYFKESSGVMDLREGSQSILNYIK